MLISPTMEETMKSSSIVFIAALFLVACNPGRALPGPIANCPDDDIRVTQTVDCPTTVLTAEGTFVPITVNGAAFAKLDTKHLIGMTTQQGAIYEDVALRCDNRDSHLGNFSTNVKMVSNSGPTHQVVYDLDVWAASGNNCEAVSVRKIFLLGIGANFPIKNWFVYRDTVDSTPIERGDIERSSYYAYPQGDYITYQMVLSFTRPLDLLPGEHTRLLFVIDTEQRTSRSDAFLHVSIKGDGEWRTASETDYHRRWFGNELAGIMIFDYTTSR